MCNFVMDGLLYGQMEKRRNLSGMMWSIRVKLGQVVWMFWVRFEGTGCWTRVNEMNEATEKWTNDNQSFCALGALLFAKDKNIYLKG